MITYKVKFLLLAVLMLQVFFCNIASSQSSKVIQIRDNILSAGDQRFEAVEEIDKLQLRIEDRISLYMELLNYYIGEATEGILCEQITRVGDKILPFLIEKKNSPVNCEEKYKSICLTLEVRNRVIIDKLIRNIKEGTIWYYDLPENVRIEAENNMKIIRIFLADFKKQKGSFPRDLNVLREYGWKQYGYKLTIVNPWGQPFKYLLQGRDKYILELGKESPEE